MRYGLLDDTDKIQKGDEIYSATLNQWIVIDTDAYRDHKSLCPVRRLLNKPDPVEVFTIPCGPWVGCTGSVFMDGDQKKVRLHNVFVGAEQHVIDFPRRQRYDNKHFILEKDDIIMRGDKFVSSLDNVNDCDESIGMTVKAAVKRYAAINLVLRPVS